VRNDESLLVSKKRGGGDRAIDEEMAKRKQKDRAVVDTFQPPIPTVLTL
jgi:hypothetical protein